MGTTPVGTITPAGFTRPSFSFCLDYRQTNVRAIYGQDVYLGEDCQDGQLEALNAQGIYDVSGIAQAVYNAFSPLTAMGSGLDRVIKINGLRRKRWSYSTAPFRCVGQAGTEIEAGTVTDAAGNVWALPGIVVIPDAGETVVTATCQTKGAVVLAAGALATDAGLGTISTATRGWQSVNNTEAATPGQPIESDSAIRQRQAVSTALPSLRLIDGLTGALAAITGVNRLKVYENPRKARDANGIPGGMIAAVVDGGDAQAIAQVIELKKGPGVSTFGSTVRTVQPLDDTTIPQDVAFFYLGKVRTRYAVTVRSLGGYTDSVEGIWKGALAGFVNGLGIGEDVQWDQAFAAAKNYDGLGSKTFKIVSFAQARDAAPPAQGDVAIAFYEAATCDVADIVITVLPAGS